MVYNIIIRISRKGVGSSLSWKYYLTSVFEYFVLLLVLVVLFGLGLYFSSKTRWPTHPTDTSTIAMFTRAAGSTCSTISIAITLAS